jgi:predicted nuclease with TOPRIM domain
MPSRTQKRVRISLRRHLEEVREAKAAQNRVIDELVAECREKSSQLDEALARAHAADKLKAQLDDQIVELRAKVERLEEADRLAERNWFGEQRYRAGALEAIRLVVGDLIGAIERQARHQGSVDSERRAEQSDQFRRSIRDAFGPRPTEREAEA